MVDDAIGSLSPQQQTCLKLTAQLYSAKEIARKLAISDSTVEGYLAEATRRLGARNKREAARIYAAFEEDICPPEILGKDFSRLAKPARMPFSSVNQGGAARSDKAFQFENNNVQYVADGRFHFLRRERRNNDLTSRQRLVWILAVAVVAAILFMSSITIIDSLQRLISPGG